MDVKVELDENQILQPSKKKVIKALAKETMV
jgi:hypothetical protein